MATLADVAAVSARLLLVTRLSAERQGAEVAVVVGAAVRAEQHEPGPARAAAHAAQDAPPLGADELRDPGPRAADEAVAALPAIEVRERLRLGRGLPEDRLQRELDELAERGRVDVERRGAALEGGAVVLECRRCELRDVDCGPRELHRAGVRRRADERRLGEVLRDAGELGREVGIVEGETPRCKKWF